jgi:hypothetical protein
MLSLNAFCYFYFTYLIQVKTSYLLIAFIIYYLFSFITSFFIDKFYTNSDIFLTRSSVGGCGRFYFIYFLLLTYSSYLFIFKKNYFIKRIIYQSYHQSSLPHIFP